METNVGDMPLDIFGDYASDMLGEEWTWEYFIPILNGYHQVWEVYETNGIFIFGSGCSLTGFYTDEGGFYGCGFFLHALWGNGHHHHPNNGDGNILSFA